MHDVYLHSEFWIASPASVQTRVRQAQQTALFEYIGAQPGQITVSESFKTRLGRHAACLHH